MEQQLFGLKEASEILGVSFSWLEKRVREKKVEVVWLGTKRMLSIEMIEKIKLEGVE